MYNIFIGDIDGKITPVTNWRLNNTEIGLENKDKRRQRRGSNNNCKHRQYKHVLLYWSVGSQGSDQRVEH